MVSWGEELALDFFTRIEGQFANSLCRHSGTFNLPKGRQVFVLALHRIIRCFLPSPSTL